MFFLNIEKVIVGMKRELEILEPEILFFRKYCSYTTRWSKFFPQDFLVLCVLEFWPIFTYPILFQWEELSHAQITNSCPLLSDSPLPLSPPTLPCRDEKLLSSQLCNEMKKADTQTNSKTKLLKENVTV